MAANTDWKYGNVGHYSSDGRKPNVKRVTLPLIIGLLLALGCASKKEPTQPQEQDLVVFAAASLKETFGQLKQKFESAYPGVHVILSFAGSQTLALQINNGAPCDVFASADSIQMKAAEEGSRIDPKAVLQFAANRLVVLSSRSSQVKTFDDLAKPGVKVVIADSKVPAGKYSLLMLNNAGKSFAKAVLNNVVSREQDVRAVLTKVELGEADAGLVYRTDAMVAPPTLNVIDIPKKDAVDSDYFIAPLEGKEQTLSTSFVSLVMSQTGQNILAEAGFLVNTK